MIRIENPPGTSGGGSTPMTALTYTATGGTLTAAPIAIRTQPQQYEFQGAITNYVGKWASTIMLQQNTSVTAVSFDDLEGVLAPITIGTGLLATALSFPALKFATNLPVSSGTTALVTVSCPALEYISANVSIANLSALTTITLPAIISIGTGISSNTGNGALTTFTLGSTLKYVGGNVNFASSALLVASVDDILVRLAALDGTNGTIAYSNRTVTITGTSATPSAIGLAAKAVLVARGCTVTNN